MPLKGKGMRAIVCKLAWWATIYYLWSQRNVVLHAGRSRQKIKSSILSRKMLRLGFKAKSASRIPF